MKGRRIRVWTGWSGQQICRSPQQSWSALCRLNSNYLNLSCLTGFLRTFWTASILSRRLWAFNSLLTIYCVVHEVHNSQGSYKFTKLPKSSIDSFKQLSNAFLYHFVGGQRPKRPVDHLLTIRQGEKETLRSYVK